MTQFLFKYKVTADDYLQHQLFSASINPIIKKQRKRGLLLWTTAFILLGIIFLIQKNLHLGIYFIIFGIGFIFIYPAYSRWIYKRYYKRIVYKNFKESELQNMNLKISDDTITLFNNKGEGSINCSEITNIYETNSHLFIKIEKGKNIIIPKLKVENKDELSKAINLLIKKNNIDYLIMNDWKWK